MSETNPSAKEAQNLAGSDAKNYPNGSRDTSGWNAHAREAYLAEQARLKEEAAKRG